MIHEVPTSPNTDNIPETIPVGALEAEIACTSTACHVYPRNYHAWTHRRLCAKALVFSLHPEDPSKLGVLVDEYQRTLKWIESHVSDYSAMNHAIILERLWLDGKPTDGRLSTKVHAASLLRLYPDHESLWMYLRGSLTHKDGEELFAPVKEVQSVRKFVLRHITWRKIFVSVFFVPQTDSFLKQ